MISLQTLLSKKGKKKVGNNTLLLEFILLLQLNLSLGFGLDCNLNSRVSPPIP